MKPPMREVLMTLANEAYADHFEAAARQNQAAPGFDGWLAAVRAFFFLAAGLAAIGLLATA